MSEYKSLYICETCNASHKSKMSFGILAVLLHLRKHNNLYSIAKHINVIHNNHILFPKINVIILKKLLTKSISTKKKTEAIWIGKLKPSHT